MDDEAEFGSRCSGGAKMDHPRIFPKLPVASHLILPHCPILPRPYLSVGRSIEPTLGPLTRDPV